MARNLLCYHDKLWNEINRFTYTGNDQPFTLDKGTYLFVCNGASGGCGRRQNPDGVRFPVNGGTTYGIIDLKERTTFHAVVGGDGGNSGSLTEPGEGGFNGGARGGVSVTSNYECGAGGGGATDIRLLPYDPNEYPTYDHDNDKCIYPENKITRTVDVEGVSETYTILEYIYAIGGTYTGSINTEYIPKTTTKLEMHCLVYENNIFANECLFGSCRNSYQSNSFSFYSRSYNANKPAYERANAEVVGDSFVYNENIRIVCYQKTAEWFLENQEEPIGSMTVNTTNPLNDCVNTLFINDRNSYNGSDGLRDSGYYSKFRLYRFKIYEVDDETGEEELVRDFIPCIRDSDNKVGLFDEVTNIFVTTTYSEENYRYWERGPAKTNHPSLNSRIMVAGGGGGGINILGGIEEYGYGGGAYGGPFYGQSSAEPYYGFTSSQVNGYAFGYGCKPTKRVSTGAYSAEGAGGGGGGWYGGYASTYSITASNQYLSINGGGGSGYVYTESSHIPEGYTPDEKYQFHDITMIPMGSQQSSVIIYELTSMKREDMITFPMIGRTEHLHFAPGEYNLQVYGASGSITYDRTHFRNGGYSHGILTLTKDHDVYVNVGGSGLCNDIGYPVAFNGGGKPTSETFTTKKYGGGGSDIRIDSNDIYSRIIVAGGSGAEGTDGGYGGYGGGEDGGQRTGNTGGTNYGPGTQKASGTYEGYDYCGKFGQGGNETVNGYASGGGGWYGGCATAYGYGGGGSGGSGYVLTEKSYKPDGYLVDDEELYLTNAETIENGNTLPIGQTQIQIKVNNIMQNILCRDSEGIKYFDTETNEWILCPTQVLSESLFEEYGSYSLTFDGLDDKFEVLAYNNDDEFDKLILNVVPPRQEIRLYTHRKMDGSSLMIDDEEFDEDIFEADIKLLHEKKTNNVIITVCVDKLKPGKQEYRLYSAQMFYNGDLGAYKYISSEEQERLKQLHSEEYYQYNQSTPGREHFYDENGYLLTKQWLLPVGSGTNIPVEYRTDIIDGDVTFINSICYTEFQRSIYIGMCVTKGYGNNTDWNSVQYTYFIVKKLSMTNGTLEKIVEVPYSKFENNTYYRIGGMLVDDKTIYVCLNNMRYIYKIDISEVDVESEKYATEVVLSNQYSSDIQAYGHLVWFDNDHTIISAARQNQLLLYNIEDNYWSTVSIPLNYAPRWIEASRKVIATSSNNGPYVLFIDKATLQTKTFTLQLSSSPLCCYHEGTWYIAQRNYIYMIDEATIFDDSKTVVDKTIALTSITNDVADIKYAGGALFITQHNNSRSLIIYDLENDIHHNIYMRWAIPNFGDRSIFPAFSFKGTYYLLRNSLLYIDYSGITKYNLGYKYNRYIGYYNQSMADDLEYDDRFVKVNNACTIVTDGDIEYEFTQSGNIASATVSKKDFRSVNRMSRSYKE